jgi:arabinofuranan 3-O-arabinosyltransferase
VQTAVSTTVDVLASGRPIPARPCDTTPIALRPGSQELLISPGPAFVADGIELNGPLAASLTPATTTPAEIGAWSADHREITVTRSASARVLVVPESVNPGWVAHTPGGTTLNPVTVNGWQQGWVLPAGERGPITLSFPADRVYRSWLAAGLALLPVLLLLALIPARRRESDDAPQPWSSRPAAAAAAVLAGTAIGGAAGAAAVIAALRQRDVVVSLGHSAASEAQAEAGFEAGVTMLTHALNAMPGLAHRSPGPVAAVLQAWHPQWPP